MKIRKANEKDFYESLKIAKSLNHWFSSYSVSNSMPIDFKVNNLVAAIDKNEVIGFLCYSTWEGEMKINWIGVKKDCQSKGVGSYLIKWLENKAKTLNSDYLLVETLSEEYRDKYYAKTRKFYSSLGFKKVYDIKAMKPSWNNTILLEKKLK